MVEIGPRADEARRIATLPMEDRVCEIIELLKASSSRQAVLEEAAKLVKSFWITAEYDHIGDADVLESVCAQASEAILALATTPPAEGETK